MFPMSITLQATVFAKRLKVLNNLFSGHTSPVTVIKYELAYQWQMAFYTWPTRVTQKLTLAAALFLLIFMKKFFCDKIFHSTFSEPSDPLFFLGW